MTKLQWTLEHRGGWGANTPLPPYATENPHVTSDSSKTEEYPTVDGKPYR